MERQRAERQRAIEQERTRVATFKGEIEQLEQQARRVASLK